MAPTNSSNKLGEIMMESGLLTREQLSHALKEQKKSRAPLGNVLLDLGHIDEKGLLTGLSKQSGLEKIELDSYHIPREALRLIPPSVAQRLKIIPLSLNNGQLTVAMADPFDIDAVEEIERLTGYPVDIKLATEKGILKAVETYYKDKGGSDRGPKRIEELLEGDKPGTVAEKEEKDTPTIAPVVKLVNQLIFHAVKEGATDIHIEPKEKELVTRFRIDGILREGPVFPKALQPAITSRIKIMANLNISENRLPQDGRITFRLGEKRIDLRVSTVPSIFGEKLVLRILDKERLVLGLEDLGFSPRHLAVFKDCILKAHGIILVCGPTGSGKTTTLYSALSYLNSKEKSIVTLEDPVEYQLPNLTQCQINSKIGFTFASGLRTILRQDPDVILVGEMRDAETVEAAMRAAITGHLVFSTLHTNDAAGAITRLLDMGVEPYLLSSSLVAIVAQRLVRRICTFCKEKVRLEERLLKMTGLGEKGKRIVFYRGRGCDRCYGTGYRGRIAIFEILPVTPSIASLISKRADSQTIQNKAREEGMTTMMQDGLQKAAKGITTVEEVVRVSYGS